LGVALTGVTLQLPRALHKMATFASCKQ
jgi:hypothetical protein